MKYLKKYVDQSEWKEITKEEAHNALSGYWKEEALKDIFDNEKAFRLWTPFVHVETKTEDGRVPVAGFWGVCD